MEPPIVGSKRKELLDETPSKIARTDKPPLTVGRVMDAVRELFLEFMNYGMVDSDQQVTLLTPFFPPPHKTAWSETEVAEKLGNFFAAVAPHHLPFSCYFDQRVKGAERLIDSEVTRIGDLFEKAGPPFRLTANNEFPFQTATNINLPGLTALDLWRRLNSFFFKAPKLAPRVIPQINSLAEKILHSRVKFKEWVDDLQIVRDLQLTYKLNLKLDRQINYVSQQLFYHFKQENVHLVIQLVYFMQTFHPDAIKKIFHPDTKNINDIIAQLPPTHLREKLLLIKRFYPEPVSSLVFFPSGESRTLESYEHEGLCHVSHFYQAQVNFHTNQKKPLEFTIGHLTDQTSPSLADFNLFLYFALGTIFHPQPGPRTVSLEDWKTLIRMANFFQLKQSHATLFEYLNEEMLPRTLEGLAVLLELQHDMQSHLEDPQLQKCWIDFREAFFANLLVKQTTQEGVDALFEKLFSTEATYPKDQPTWLFLREFNFKRLDLVLRHLLNLKPSPRKLVLLYDHEIPPTFDLNLFPDLKIYGTYDRDHKKQKESLRKNLILSRNVEELELCFFSKNRDWYQKNLCRKLTNLKRIKFRVHTDTHFPFDDWIKRLITPEDFKGVEIYFEGKLIERQISPPALKTS